ncbi:MAG: sigma 54-interacting transcriptional regulator [Deltaproteobacteria bacterium]|nr:sigma 54-interacting transcriptional regulator [Deltaproteobacteria bacterium]
MQAGHLLIIGPGGDAQGHALERETTTIGSDITCDVRLQDAGVAPVHAEIIAKSSGFSFFRRATPIWVNGKRTAAQPLEDGDIILVGRTAISFRSHSLGPSLKATQDEENPSRSFSILRSLYRLSRRLAEGEDPHAVAREMVADVAQFTGADRGELVLFEAAGVARAADLFSSRHGEFDAKDLQLSQTAMAKLREDPRPRLWSDIDYDLDLAQAPSLHGAGVRSLMAAPIMVADELLGALYLSSGGVGKLFGQQDLDLLALYANQVALLMASANRDRRLTEKVHQAERDLELVREESLVGSSLVMQELLATLHKVAHAEIPVLLLGETGTGKELLARQVHRAGEREGPFIAVNCGAIPGPLLESELFGHVKGAFTGAIENRVGRIRSAAGGVLFLDEIGEMPLEQQAKLLRVLQEREVVPVGGDKAHAVDFRLVCATNQRLDVLAEQGGFRSDLYYRIADFVLEVPPLRDRGDDAIELAQFFLKRQAVLLGTSEGRLSASAMTAIRSHGWPGNVRQLGSAVRRALVLCEGGMVQPSHLGLVTSVPGDDDGLDTPTDADIVLPLAQARDSYLKRYVAEAVQRCGGNRTEAASLLRVTPRTIFKYLEEI